MIFICTYCFVDKSTKENVTESVNVKPQQSSKLRHQQIFSDQHVLHVESSDVQQQVALEAQVKEDVKKLYENFASVVTNVKVKLAVLVENEPSKLTQITQYIEEHYQLSHLAEVKNVNELFDSISSRYCFLNCNLVKGVVEEFLSGDEVHSELTQYLKDLDIFKMSTQLRYIKTAIKEILLQNQEVTETCTVSIILNEIWGCTTLKKFENFFCLTFGKNLNYLNQLCTELGKECVCVSFVTPVSKLEFLIDKVLPQKEFIQRVGIIEISVNNDIIISPDETNLEQCFLEFAEAGNQFGISTLLELGVDVDHKSSDSGRTALMIASYAGHQQCVQMLTSANANVDVQDNKGYTALMLATECNSIDIVSHLLSVNANDNLQTQKDDTALTMIACRNCQADISKVLLDYEAVQQDSKSLLVSTDIDISQQVSLEAQVKDTIKNTQSYYNGKLLVNTYVLFVFFYVTESVNVKPQQFSKFDQQQIFSDQHGSHVESSHIHHQMTSEAQIKDVKKLNENFVSVVTNVKVKLAVLVENEPSKLTQITQYIEEHYQLSHLAEVKDVNELFDSISSRYCFLSCDLVRGVVEEFLSEDEVHSELTQYSKDLDIFKMSTQLRYIKTAIKEVLLQNQEFTETCTVSIKLNKIWGCTTLKKFENFFCLTFGKNLSYLNQLCTELGKECVCVSFVTPVSKLEFLIDKVLPQKEFLQRVGIIEISVNNDIIISPDETNLEQCFLEFAEAGNQFGISTLLELGVDVDHKSSERRTALMIASYAGHQQCVQMLTSSNANVDVQDNKGYTALMLATECNSIDIVSHLLSVNASVNLQTQEDDTALTIACRNCQADIVKLLLDCKADPFVANYKALLVSTATEQHNDILVQLLKCLHSESDLSEVLSVACLNGQPQIISTLLQHIDTSITSEQIQITISCAKGDYSTVENYINHSNVDVNYPFLPPLIIASSCGHISIVNMLLKQQVNVSIRTHSGLTGLMAASKNGHHHIAEILQKYYRVNAFNKLCLSAFNSVHYSEAIRLLPLVSEPKSIHTKVCDTSIPSTKGYLTYFDPKDSIGLLHLAAWNGWLDIMKTLIDRYEFEPEKGDCDIYILHMAVLNKHIDVVKYLITECGCDPMCKNNDEWTYLHYAGQYGSLEIAVAHKHIIECGCDPMFKNSDGWTCLHYAGACGSLDIMKYLTTECKCDPKVTDKNGSTCLHIAVLNKNIDVLKYLITKCKCDPIVANKNGATCLHLAVFNRDIDVVKYLITECGCDPMCKDNNGWTCLHYAGAYGSLDIMKYLITECKCDPMVTNKDGATCLHVAVLNKHIDVVKCLIFRFGCDPMYKDNDGWTCLHYAGQRGSLDIMKYLITECNCDPMATNKDGSTCLHITVANRHLSLTEYLLSTNKINPFARNNYYITAIGQCQFDDKPLQTLFTKFNEVKISHPVDSFVNVLLLGNPGAGKSTLAKVISERAVSTAWFGQFRYVQGVEPYTAGIIPTKLTHHELGNIILHDFAGQSEYYTSHTVVIENLLQGSAAVFVIVVNILEEEATKHLQQWLTTVTNEASKALNQCHIIVAVSHVDEMTDTVTKERKQSELQQIIKERCVSIEYLDCRKLGGSSVSSLFSKLSSACQSIRNTSGRNLSLYCHMMYGLLEESKQNILSLSDIISIAETSDQYFVPKDEEEILEILSSLHSTGLITLFKSSNKVWVVFNKQILLADVNGILFAPKSFKQYCDIASNTGIITVSALTKIFPDYDPDMLICFLKNMALCQEVNPHQLFVVTNLSSSTYDDKESFLFFPTLLKVNRPDNIGQEVFQFGWYLQCTEHYHFFSSHFMHNLILNLSYKYALPVHVSPNNLNCKSIFWKNGIHWFNGNGVGTLVELVDESQCILVLMSCEVGYESEMVSLQKDVITEVMNVWKESCPSLKLSDFIIDPQDLTYPIGKPTQRTVYNVQDIIYCIIHEKDFVGSKPHSNNQIGKEKELSELLQLTDIHHLSTLKGQKLDKVQYKCMMYHCK